jgi:hypothetical protein
MSPRQRRLHRVDEMTEGKAESFFDFFGSCPKGTEWALDYAITHIEACAPVVVVACGACSEFQPTRTSPPGSDFIGTLKTLPIWPMTVSSRLISKRAVTSRCPSFASTNMIRPGR